MAPCAKLDGGPGHRPVTWNFIGVVEYLSAEFNKDGEASEGRGYDLYSLESMKRTQSKGLPIADRIARVLALTKDEMQLREMACGSRALALL